MVDSASSGRASDTQDEALLESLFARLSPSPVSLLRAALRFAAQHPGTFNPELISSALKRRGQQQSPAWLARLEPSIGTQEVMLLTGLSKSGVHKAKDENRLLAFRLEGQNVARFPLFQFKTGEVRAWISVLLSRVGNGLASAHFLAVARKRLNGHSYVDLLRERDDDDVITAMLRHAESIGDEARGREPEPTIKPAGK